MTDRPERPSTIVPPAPDRDKTTDRPLPTDKAPPEDLLQLSENVFARLGAVEDALKQIKESLAERLSKIDQLHALLMGSPTKQGAKRTSIVSALHDLTGHVGVAGANAELVAEQQKTLPKLIAQEVSNALIALYQGEMKNLHEADDAQMTKIKELELRIAELHPPGANGSRKSE